MPSLASAVLDVVPELGPVGALQPRLERTQHLVDRQLFGHAGVAVPQRHVGGLPDGIGERQTDQARPHRVERIGEGVERNERRRFEAGDPGIEPVAGDDGLVLLVDRRGP